MIVAFCGSDQPTASLLVFQKRVQAKIWKMVERAFAFANKGEKRLAMEAFSAAVDLFHLMYSCSSPNRLIGRHRIRLSSIPILKTFILLFAIPGFESTLERWYPQIVGLNVIQNDGSEILRFSWSPEALSEIVLWVIEPYEIRHWLMHGRMSGHYFDKRKIKTKAINMMAAIGGMKK